MTQQLKYDIKAIPTTYAGVNFRSRLEARWAAFFDLCGWKWDYEPFDLDGWAPDFLIRTDICDVLVEVKPFDLSRKITEEVAKGYLKACRYRDAHQVLLLGIAPLDDVVGSLLDPPSCADYTRREVDTLLSINSVYDKITGEIPSIQELWRTAGNTTRWNGADNDYIEYTIDYNRLVNNAIHRGLARASGAATI